ncbi:MAG: hypothetical protein H6732_02985 [Alphaproteobacteria bacterium]|nr:hypothetical protein [Alphaproteobacteria bacterium]
MSRLLLLLLPACWSPKDTGPTSMVGHLRDSSGQPLAGVHAHTPESHWTTDAEGAFRVNYKDPSLWVRFDVADVVWQRAYLPEDRGTVVEVRLPSLEAGTVRCDVAAPCDAELRWEVAPGLHALLALSCPAGGDVAREALPPGSPTRATCRTTATAPAQPLSALRQPDGTLRLALEGAP